MSVIFIIFNYNLSWSQREDQSVGQRAGDATVRRIISRSDNFFKDKTRIKDPFRLRDPFKEPIVKEERIVDIKKGTFKDGVFTNLGTIEGVPISEILITGVLVGRERRALAKVRGNEATYILREGMTLGQDKAEIKAILPGGVVLVEKIINVYGQEEYLETVLPISSD